MFWSKKNNEKVIVKEEKKEVKVDYSKLSYLKVFYNMDNDLDYFIIPYEREPYSGKFDAVEPFTKIELHYEPGAAGYLADPSLSITNDRDLAGVRFEKFSSATMEEFYNYINEPENGFKLKDHFAALRERIIFNRQARAKEMHLANQARERRAAEQNKMNDDINRLMKKL